MKGEPGGIAVMIAKKARGESDESEGKSSEMYEEAARDMIKAIKDDDPKLLASVLEALKEG